MAVHHSPRFLMIVEDAKTRIRETTVEEIKARMDRGERFALKFPDVNTPLVLYCGGGFRSALAADNLQKMGYTNVMSMDGGVRGWREKGYPFVKD